MTTNIIDTNAMGADFCWSFGDGTAEACMLPRTDLRELFVEQGFAGTLIATVEIDEALRRSATTIRKGRRIVVKEMERKNRDTPRAYGIYRVTPVQGEGGDNIECGARVRVQTATEAVCLPPEGGMEIPECLEIGAEIVRRAHELVENAYNLDLSDSLRAIGANLGWISRRRIRGGVYYLNREKAERFARLLKSIQALSAAGDRPWQRQFVAHITEQYDRPLTVESWSRAAQDHYAEKSNKLIQDLDRVFRDGKMRASTMTERAMECDAILKEANEYSMFLAGNLRPLQERLRKIQAAFQKAIAEGGEAIEKDLEEIGNLVGRPIEPRTPRAILRPEPEPEPEPTHAERPKLTVEDFDIFA